MTTPRILVIGAGSIGARHARNLRGLGATVDIADPDASRAAAIPGVSPRRFDLGNIDGYDGIVIASPTVHHARQLHAAVETGAKVLVEKPLALAEDDLDAIVQHARDRAMVGYNLRLHRPLEQVAAILDAGTIGQIVSGRLWFGSWLPDWRPDVDYRSTYSAQRVLGGGVLLDAIHEIDEALWLFGEELEVHSAYVGRVGPLDIDVEDTVKAVLLSGGSVPIELSLDYLSRPYRRGVEVIGVEGTIGFDWHTSELIIDGPDGRHVDRIDTPIAESYLREAERFLRFVTGQDPAVVDAATGATSVRLAARICEVAGWT